MEIIDSTFSSMEHQKTNEFECDQDTEQGNLFNHLITGALLLTVGLVALKRFDLAIWFLCFTVLVLSLHQPVNGIVLVIAYYTCDQLMIGLGKGEITPGRYLLLLNILICAGFIFFLRHPQKLNLAYQFYLYYLLVLLGVLTLFWAENTRSGTIYLVKLSILCLWGRMILPFLSKRNVLEKLSFLMTLTTSIVSVILIFGGVSVTTHSDHRIILEGLGINSIAISIGFVVIFSSVYMAGPAHVIKKIAIILLNVINFLAILKMGTRSVVIGIPLALIIGIVVTDVRFIGRYFVIIVLITGIMGGVLYYSIDHKLITGKLADRFSELNNIESYTENSRVKLANYSFKIISEHPMGTGAGNEVLAFGDFKYKMALFESHNTFFSTMIQFGILGLSVLCVSWFFLIFQIFLIQNVILRYLSMVTLIFLLIQLLKGSMLQTRLYWIPLILIFSLIEVGLSSGSKDGSS